MTNLNDLTNEMMESIYKKQKEANSSLASYLAKVEILLTRSAAIIALSNQHKKIEKSDIHQAQNLLIHSIRQFCRSYAPDEEAASALSADAAHMIAVLKDMLSNNQTPSYINTSIMPGRWNRWQLERLHEAITELNKLGIVHDGFVCRRTPINRKSVKFSVDWSKLETIGVGK